ncbi:MAG: hypothetical protein Q8S14_00630 [Algoriphagus sp.]|uniref:hypothetical protein n=1 Tax=Algoriphagus sp. TaxID=1872435 RepID=UPI00272F6827|nr:hypothetical protein [Algoriphagus sp.]MDP2039949.1 hypothetical protein [Algoriphagus sp.]MDP3470346.1 hypothetical protein [Algoriphagus sp.]
MKAIIISTLFILGFLTQAKAQLVIKDGLYFNKAGRQVWIVETNGKKHQRALLYKVSKDSLFFVESNLKTLSPQYADLEIKSLHYSDIDTLVTQKNRPGAKGAVIGGVIGFAAGMAIRAATYDPDPITKVVVILTGGESAHYFMSGLLGASAGVAIGAGIGAIAKKKWVIGGNKENFEKALLLLDERAYWNKSSRPRPSPNL